MFYVSIKKQNIETNAASFETLDLANAWIVDCEAGKMWGEPAYTEIIPEVLEIKDELGEIIQAAAPEQVIEHAAEYTIEITDITSLVQQEKLNKESLEFLAQTDWYIVRELETGVLAPVEIKTSRAEARARVVR
jgi:hypothetical protein